VHVAEPGLAGSSASLQHKALRGALLEDAVLPTLRGSTKVSKRHVIRAGHAKGKEER